MQAMHMSRRRKAFSKGEGGGLIYLQSEIYSGSNVCTPGDRENQDPGRAGKRKGDPEGQASDLCGHQGACYHLICLGGSQRAGV